MDDQEKSNHWNVLASELGADPLDENALEDVASHPAMKTPSSAPEPPATKDTPPAAPRPQTDWNALAGDLGLEPSPIPPPVKTTPPTAAAEPSDDKDDVSSPSSENQVHKPASRTDVVAGQADPVESSDPYPEEISAEKEVSGWGLSSDSETDESSKQNSGQALAKPDRPAEPLSGSPEDNIFNSETNPSEPKRSRNQKSAKPAVGGEAAFDLSIFENENRPTDSTKTTVPSDDESESRPKRRRRGRRRGRRRPKSDAEQEVSTGEKSLPDSSESTSGENTEPRSDRRESTDEESRTRRPRRRRRKKESKPPTSTSITVEESGNDYDSFDVFDDITEDKEENDFSTPASASENAASQDSEDAQRSASRHRKIPSWEDAVGVIVSANLASRSKSPSGGRGRGRGRGSKR